MGYTYTFHLDALFIEAWEGACISDIQLTFLFLLCRSPTEFTRVLGPRIMRVLWGHCVHTSVCSPSRILRMFSAPVTRTRGLPKRWVLKTFPCFSRLEMWKLDPCKNTRKNSLEGCNTPLLLTNSFLRLSHMSVNYKHLYSNVYWYRNYHAI